MAPGQNTFSIIPNAPGAINGDSDTLQSRPNTRPMTTKQAKKSYQKANKGPKLSKAEKRRQELFEQDRIRKEFEKEKNQARAKAARDRKREKEEKERAEKKKKGLPLVDVHPSQDTIAWFVRGSGRKKQDSSVVNSATVNKNNGDDRNDRDDRVSSSDENEPEPPPKRQRTESPAPSPPPPVLVPINANLDLGADPVRSPSPTGVIGEVPPPPDVNEPVERWPTPDHSNIDIDEPETIESLPDDLFNELVDATINSSSDETTAPNAGLRRPSSNDQKTSDNQLSPKPPNNCFRSPTADDGLLPEQKTEDSASLSSIRRPLQQLSTTKVNSRTSSTPQEPITDQVKSTFPTNNPLVDSPAQAPPKSVQPSMSMSRSFHPPKTPMGPPPIPPKFKPRSHVPSKDPRTPPFLAKQSHTPNSYSIAKPKPIPQKDHIHPNMREELLPTSTQLFVLGHLDDFFPSPSQEVRELFEEPKLCVGMSNDTSQTRATYLGRSPPSKIMSTHSISDTPDLNRLTPIAKNSKPKSIPIQENVFSAHASNYPLASDTQMSGDSEAFDMPFFSTQDFVLSSQDMKDLGDETMSPSGFKQRNHNLQSINIASNPSSYLLNVTRCDINTHSTTTIPQLPVEQAEIVGYPNGLIPAHKQVTSSNSQIKDGVKLLEKTEHRVLPITDRSHRNETANTLRSKNDAAQSYPRPFFASSGREAHYKYVIERSKTTSWEGPSTRQKAQEELQHFQRSEDERSSKLLAQLIPEDKEGCAMDKCTSDSGSGPRDSTPRPTTQPKSQSQPRSINQLSSLAVKGTQSQKAEEPAEKRQRQNHSRSSYEEMLELLKRKESEKQGQQVMPASQETDYGEAGLDDVLYEIL
ncbi:uncharacterized protein GGS22DRAFT_112266 [Annulohypoxylon maeteangense]|uniref:uncharacterized protein n=1 Tax=Annulohypoxylon maeteangense TaxID=1927788 RepID=UPI00200816C6|nr:uncharacterized protein GGS22DRAFT_112266 [Annulohypoxylon maeteangense]KAI0887643.1 hypothetical protein GGS22DRAFT_112266 [Annulohypoxylon maeteangense]